MSAMIEVPAAYRHAAGTRGALALLREAVSDVTSRRRLVRYLVQAEMRKRGADTILGNLWWVLDPLLQMLVYVVLVTILARGLYPDYPLFIFAAILPWKWFTTAVSDATGSVVGQERLIKQIAFPKIVLPVSSATAGVIGFLFGLIPLTAILLLYGHRASLLILLIPFIAVVQYVFTLAVAVLVSALNVFFRDVGNVARHFLRLWWYMSPGLYSLELLAERNIVQENPIILTIASLNPFAILFESYRAVIYGVPVEGGRPFLPDFTALAGLLVTSLVLLALASIVFKRVEPNFAKVL